MPEGVCMSMWERVVRASSARAHVKGREIIGEAPVQVTTLTTSIDRTRAHRRV